MVWTVAERKFVRLCLEDEYSSKIKVDEKLQRLELEYVRRCLEVKKNEEYEKLREEEIEIKEVQENREVNQKVSEDYGFGEYNITSEEITPNKDNNLMDGNSEDKIGQGKIILWEANEELVKKSFDENHKLMFKERQMRLQETLKEKVNMENPTGKIVDPNLDGFSVEWTNESGKEMELICHDKKNNGEEFVHAEYEEVDRDIANQRRIYIKVVVNNRKKNMVDGKLLKEQVKESHEDLLNQHEHDRKLVNAKNAKIVNEAHNYVRLKLKLCSSLSALMKRSWDPGRNGTVRDVVVKHQNKFANY